MPVLIEQSAKRWKSALQLACTHIEEHENFEMVGRLLNTARCRLRCLISSAAAPCASQQMCHIKKAFVLSNGMIVDVVGIAKFGSSLATSCNVNDALLPILAKPTGGNADGVDLFSYAEIVWRVPLWPKTGLFGQLLRVGETLVKASDRADGLPYKGCQQTEQLESKRRHVRPP